MRILNIQAHPDDAECSCGGTIAKYALRGDEIHYLICTKGNRGTFDVRIDIDRLAEIRKGEVLRAAQILGVKDVRFLGEEDGYLYPDLGVRGKIIRVIREVKPEIVMTLDPLLPYEIHPDHRTVGMLAAEATVFSGFPHFYPDDLRQGIQPWFVRELWFYATREPNYWEDITEHIGRKVEACYAHESQVQMAGFQRKEVTGAPRSVEELGKEEFRKLAVGRAEKDGRRAGVKYAEAFKRFEVRPGHLVLD